MNVARFSFLPRHCANVEGFTLKMIFFDSFRLPFSTLISTGSVIPSLDATSLSSNSVGTSNTLRRGKNFLGRRALSPAFSSSFLTVFASVYDRIFSRTAPLFTCHVWIGLIVVVTVRSFFSVSLRSPLFTVDTVRIMPFVSSFFVVLVCGVDLMLSASQFCKVALA